MPTALADLMVKPNMPLLDGPTSSLPVRELSRLPTTQDLPRTKLAITFPAQKKPTQNLATTYIRKEVETPEKVLKNMIPNVVMVMVFFGPMLSANLPRIKEPKISHQL